MAYRKLNRASGNRKALFRSLSSALIMNGRIETTITKATRKLFDELAPKYQDRQGGFTRIYRVGPRRGDAAEMAIIELL